MHLAVDAAAVGVSGWVNTGLISTLLGGVAYRFRREDRHAEKVDRTLDVHSQALAAQSHALDIQSRALAVVVAKIDPTLAVVLHTTSAEVPLDRTTPIAKSLSVYDTVERCANSRLR